MPNSRIVSTMNLKRSLLCLATMAALSASGCATDEELAASDEQASAERGDQRDELGYLQVPPAATVPDPNGMYFADVTANGTGCPTGTWRANISPDGTRFDLLFNEYIIQVDEQTQLALKDCTVAIKLRSPSGLSFTITDFRYEGYAVLEEGVKGRQTASYYFQGMPTLTTEKRTDLLGPVDDPYLFHDTVGIVDAVWSPCGVERLLNVKTLLRLTNSTPRRSGIMNLSNVAGATESKISFRLNYRKCPTATPAPTKPASGGTSGRGGRR